MTILYVDSNRCRGHDVAEHPPCDCKIRHALGPLAAVGLAALFDADLVIINEDGVVQEPPLSYLTDKLDKQGKAYFFLPMPDAGVAAIVKAIQQTRESQNGSRLSRPASC